MTAPLTLGFDTSGAYCSACLLHGDTVLAAAHEEMAKGQAERLMVLLEEVLAVGHVTWGDLDRIGVGIGPGNFTGIRIAVSAARGLALALEVPAVGVSTLEALAHGQTTPVLTCVDARRGSVYLQGFNGAPLPDPSHYTELPDLPHVALIGSAAQMIADHTGAPVLPATYAPGSAIARVAASRSADQIIRPAPLYLRAADAKPSTAPIPAILT